MTQQRAFLITILGLQIIVLTSIILYFAGSLDEFSISILMPLGQMIVAGGRVMTYFAKRNNRRS